MANKTPVNDLDANIKKTLTDAIKSKSAKLKCPECEANLGSWTISGLLSSTRTVKCPKTDCGANYQVDMDGVKEVLKEVDRI